MLDVNYDGSIEAFLFLLNNEPELVGNKKMQTFLRELIHERKQLPSTTNFSKEQISNYETEYKKILGSIQ